MAVPSDSWGQLWAAIKAVWASKWNERAVLSLRKAGLDHGQLQMAVLLQAVLPAQHAFVAHTVHPTTGELGHRELQMAVHLWAVLPAQYGSAAHTVRPATAAHINPLDTAVAPIVLKGT